MNTFLPHSCFVRSARCLDNKRLGKQRVECKQILRALGVPVGGPSRATAGWKNHPAVRMWSGAERTLALYACVMCREWMRRGFRDSLLPQFRAAMKALPRSRPSWLGDEAVHRSHRSNLLRKDPNWYARFGWSEPDYLPYFWPKGKE
jgi:hypothetical protein